jgi:hypothetical protein
LEIKKERYSPQPPGTSKGIGNIRGKLYGKGDTWVTCRKLNYRKNINRAKKLKAGKEREITHLAPPRASYPLNTCFLYFWKCPKMKLNVSKV